jgi:hypothetical protein
VDHETISEFHGFGTSGTEFTRDNDFHTFGAGLHDKTEDTVAGPSDGQTAKELEFQRLGLSNGGETTVVDFFSVQLDSVLGEVESLLNNRGQFSDATSLFTQNGLSASGTDDDFGTDGSDTDLDARVTVLGELTGQELVELGKEDTVSNKLFFLGTISLFFLDDCALIELFWNERI